jgi:hypothetical protein
MKNLRIKLAINNLNREIKSLEDNHSTLTKKVIEYEKYNKSLLEKVKEINEEKDQLEKDEHEKCETIRQKCEEFKRDVVSKFQVTDTDLIRKENDTLKEKLKEYQDHSKLIEESIKQQLEFKDEQLHLIEDGLSAQLNPKLNDFEGQNEKLKAENMELRKEYNDNIQELNELQELLSKFYSNFEIGKKEFEKKAQELFKLTKENKELKSLDPTSIIEETSKYKLELDSLVRVNKEISEKISNLKKQK